MVDAHTSLYGFIAKPARHSLSPLIHNTSFQALGINSVYLAFDVEQAQFESAVQSMRALPIQGINVSMPYKQQIIEYLDELTPVAKQLEAVNTVINQDGRLIGDSTDGEGFIHALQDERVTVKGKRVAVLGAGGAGRAIILATANEGAEVTVFKRQNSTFNALRERLTSWSERIRVFPYEDQVQMAKVLQQADVIVNTTNLGMAHDARSPVSPPVMQVLHAGQMVADAIYAPLETPFLVQAKQQGCHTMNGLGMLVQQAAGSFNRWTGQQMPVDNVKEAIKQQLEHTKK
ncbi:shikimate 5-dehydrogenase [Secundilactobacillus silagincola]|uniref:Shikimate dehydrogenase (NADP(+)) n=1 Tax=Secundilactobacillus silagincola TaxID=1714681 RepID=A0A1Z5J2A7_9LACO|nr:shikimate dehydrogenase [Secundilactobacillus silagincola]GAX08147.1 shikimate 5-dehydrogenase [Secundilactobacillus silagincola]